MIYDCFTYYNEIELLELRLRTLAEVVDCFVIVEANKTFSGKSRDFHFAKHRAALAEFDSKIKYIQVTDMPDTTDEWVLQHFQRNCISRGLVDCAPDDLVLVSDVDEIPHPDALRQILSTRQGQNLIAKYPVAFAQRTFYYYVNSVYKRLVTGTVAILKKNLTEPEQMRTIRDRAPRIRDGGWHFTYLGGAERILQKIESLGHGEKNVRSNLSAEFVQSCIESGSSSIHNAAGDQYLFVQIDASFPADLPALIAKYPYLFRECDRYTAASLAFPAQPASLFFNFPRWYWYLLKCKLAGRPAY